MKKEMLIKNKGIKYLLGVIVAYGLLIGGMEVGVINYYYSGVLISILINVIMATSLALVTGYLGELVLGHAGFMAIGAYTSAIITMHLDFPMFVEFPIGLLVGGVFAAFIGVLIGIPALRLRGDYLGIITLGFGEIIRIVLNNLKITNGAKGLSGISNYSNFTITFFVTIAIVAMLFLLIKSRHGRAIIAIRENEIATDCIGISTFYYKTFAFAISAFFAGIGGGLYAHYLQGLTPSSFGFLNSIEYLIIVVLGGMGSLSGTIIAAVVLGLLNEVLRAFSEYRMLIYSLVLVAMMVCKARGVSFKGILRKLGLEGKISLKGKSVANLGKEE